MELCCICGEEVDSQELNTCSFCGETNLCEVCIDIHDCNGDN